MRELTEQQAAFVAAYVANGGNATEAAKTASYSETSARQIGSALLDKPHVMEGVRREQHRVIGGELASKAVGVLRQIVCDENAASKLRLDAAKTILDRAGLIAPKAEDRSNSEKPGTPWDKLTAGDLKVLLDRAQAAQAAREAHARQDDDEGPSAVH